MEAHIGSEKEQILKPYLIGSVSQMVYENLLLLTFFMSLIIK